MEPANHEEALLLAHAKKDSSNLARGYIEAVALLSEVLLWLENKEAPWWLTVDTKGGFDVNRIRKIVGQ